MERTPALPSLAARAGVLTGLTLAWILAGNAAMAATATTAADVCPLAADPCNVTSVFDVTDNATLDFGNRTVNVTGTGQFNFAGGSGKILSGTFTASTTNPVIDANGPDPSGGTTSGSVTLLARRKCTGGNPNVPCVDLNDCQLGLCGVRRCSKKTTKICTANANCQLGTCGTNKRCSGSVTFVRCATNSDCDYGTCPEQLSCSNRADNPVNCSANADCDFGTCSIGSASIAMGGPIVGNSDNPATIVLRAADDVSISKLVNLTSTALDADGGDLTVEAAVGSITVTSKIIAPGGGDSQGGTVELNAGNDVTVGEEVNVNGGDFDGGAVEINADRDIVIGRSLLANSSGGAGFGGEILLDAGRDLTVNGVSSSNKTTLETSGHTDIENFAGDGGTQDLSSGRNISLNVNTRVIGNGSSPDGYGSDMFIDAGADLVLNGDVTAKALGLKGTGGYVEVLAFGKTNVGTSGTFDITGGDGGGGTLEFESTGNVDFAGYSDVTGGNGGSGGYTLIDGDANVSVAGTLFVNGTSGGSLEVGACRVTLTPTGKLQNLVFEGDNKLISRESMKLLSGSSMTTGGGPNVLVYRTAAKPPVVLGTVTPAPTKILDPTLVGCPVCGNLEVDQNETCDDGNFTNGDGCNSFCQNEKCLQQTIAPGYPTVPICEDGNLCTADTCNTALNGGTCQHPAKSCGDAFSCTTDSCNAGTGECQHVTNDSSCNDQNPCTDDFCSVSTGCSATANTNSCNDNDSCTQNDQCSASACHGTPIEGCAVCGDGTATPPEQCDDGNGTFVSGEYCGVGCVLIPCGKPTNSSGTLPKSSDALFALKAAVGQATCHLRVCDVDQSGKVLASDSLRILRAAVGQAVVMNCPAA